MLHADALFYMLFYYLLAAFSGSRETQIETSMCSPIVCFIEEH